MVLLTFPHVSAAPANRPGRSFRPSSPLKNASTAAGAGRHPAIGVALDDDDEVVMLADQRSELLDASGDLIVERGLARVEEDLDGQRLAERVVIRGLLLVHRDAHATHFRLVARHDRLELGGEPVGLLVALGVFLFRRALAVQLAAQPAAQTTADDETDGPAEDGAGDGADGHARALAAAPAGLLTRQGGSGGERRGDQYTDGSFHVLLLVAACSAIGLEQDREAAPGRNRPGQRSTLTNSGVGKGVRHLFG